MTKYIFLFWIFWALNGLDYADLGDIFRHGKIRYLLVALIPVVFSALRERLTWAPALFGALALFSFVIHDYLVYSLLPLILIMAVLAAACFVVELKGKTWGRILILSGVFQATLALLQICGKHIFFTPLNAADMHVPIGLMGHESVLGAFLAACICPALWNKNYLSAFLMAVAILATKSSMACASLGAVIVLFMWYRVSFSAAAATAALGLAAMGAWFMLRPGDSFLSADGRMFIWPFGLRAVKEHPIFGVGIGGWAGHYLPIYKDEILAQFHYHLPVQLHSDYLDFLVEYGAAAFAALSVALAQFVYHFKPTWMHAVCAALLVNAIANFPLCLPPTALIFVVCWAHANKEIRHGLA